MSRAAQRQGAHKQLRRLTRRPLDNVYEMLVGSSYEQKEEVGATLLCRSLPVDRSKLMCGKGLLSPPM